MSVHTPVLLFLGYSVVCLSTLAAVECKLRARLQDSRLSCGSHAPQNRALCTLQGVQGWDVLRACNSVKKAAQAEGFEAGAKAAAAIHKRASRVSTAQCACALLYSHPNKRSYKHIKAVSCDSDGLDTCQRLVRDQGIVTSCSVTSCSGRPACQAILFPQLI